MKYKLNTGEIVETHWIDVTCQLTESTTIHLWRRAVHVISLAFSTNAKYLYWINYRSAPCEFTITFDFSNEKLTREQYLEKHKLSL